MKRNGWKYHTSVGISQGGLTYGEDPSRGLGHISTVITALEGLMRLCKINYNIEGFVIKNSKLLQKIIN